MAHVASSRRSRTVCSGAGSVCVFGEIGGSEREETDLLTAASIDEIRQLKHPPVPVKRTLEALHLVLHADRHRHGVPRGGVKWDSVLRTVCKDDLMIKLQNFDISKLRNNPELARDLRNSYFGTEEPGAPRTSTPPLQRASSRGKLATASEVLNVGRVRRASTTAAALFSWAARTIEEAETAAAPTDEKDASKVLHPISDLPQKVDSRLSEPAAETVPTDSCEEFLCRTPREVLNVGVWATCPGAHGLQVGLSGGASSCAACKCSLASDPACAGCRACRFGVCGKCRNGEWLSVKAKTATSTSRKAGGSFLAEETEIPQPMEVVGFRFLRPGEELAWPLSTEAATATASTATPLSSGAGANAWRGYVKSSAPEALTLELRSGNKVDPLHVDLLAEKDLPKPPRPGAPAARAFGGTASKRKSTGGVLDLMDSRSFGAHVLLVLCGCP
eukprot:TRINITY_DN2508_c6_g1_i1.p1 TRINITY_DN2508_c6_g1~~TRINITY_DN2508_c6_g1_i1.p1  ORF type:complete len:446 (+),score=95.03 TRINITY_DN2508_c6_g1_i1:106-1443(+)